MILHQRYKRLKDSLPATLCIITSLMNNSFKSNTFASVWKCNNQPISLLPVLSKVNERLAHRQFVRLCIKVGQGQGDGDMGTHVWEFGTSGCESRDLGTSRMGRGDMWDGDVGRQKQGRRGCGMWMIITKVRGKCDISFFVKMCYLWSTLHSIFQTTLDTLWSLHKTFIYNYRSKRTDFRD